MSSEVAFILSVGRVEVVDTADTEIEEFVRESPPSVEGF